MTKIKSITIGKLTFSKKAILIVCFGAFCFGIIFGILSFISIKTGSMFNIFLFMLFNIPVLILLKPILKKEITETN